MKLDSEGKKLLIEHQNYLKELTNYIVNDFNIHNKDVYEEINKKRFELHRQLVLIIGYTVYFGAWYQLKDIFCKNVMFISYFSMVLSLLITIYTLIFMYFREFIFDRRTVSKNKNGTDENTDKNHRSNNKPIIKWTLFKIADISALLFASFSVACFILAATFYGYYYLVH
jgi:hypothetical protein